jgi:hypothetical protein
MQFVYGSQREDMRDRVADALATVTEAKFDAGAGGVTEYPDELIDALVDIEARLVALAEAIERAEVEING